jgi:hypothetical protein
MSNPFDCEVFEGRRHRRRSYGPIVALTVVTVAVLAAVIVFALRIAYSKQQGDDRKQIADRAEWLVSINRIQALGQEHDFWMLDQRTVTVVNDIWKQQERFQREFDKVDADFRKRWAGREKKLPDLSGVLAAASETLTRETVNQVELNLKKGRRLLDEDKGKMDAQCEVEVPREELPETPRFGPSLAEQREREEYFRLLPHRVRELDAQRDDNIARLRAQRIRGVVRRRILLTHDECMATLNALENAFRRTGSTGTDSRR